jgi:hypothetical protein
MFDSSRADLSLISGQDNLFVSSIFQVSSIQIRNLDFDGHFSKIA